MKVVALALILCVAVATALPPPAIAALSARSDVVVPSIVRPSPPWPTLPPTWPNAPLPWNWQAPWDVRAPWEVKAPWDVRAPWEVKAPWDVIAPWEVEILGSPAPWPLTQAPSAVPAFWRGSFPVEPIPQVPTIATPYVSTVSNLVTPSLVAPTVYTSLAAAPSSVFVY